MYRCLLILLLVACRSSSTEHHAQDGDSPRSDATGLDAWAETMPVDGAPSTMTSDATVADAVAIVDAGYAGSDAGTPGVVSCYSEGNPTATCTLPSHCCFTNYSAQHNGGCTSTACGWGTIDCDGPEDCSGGQRCCAHALKDASNIVVGYTLSCQQAACGPAPANEELCHPTSAPTGTCSTGTCVTALGNNNDLPRTLAICR